VEEYSAKGRGPIGVLTKSALHRGRGRLAGAMIVKDGYDLV